MQKYLHRLDSACNADQNSLRQEVEEGEAELKERVRLLKLAEEKEKEAVKLKRKAGATNES